MTLFPTEQWLERYGRLLDRNEALDEVAAGWGEGFDGTVRLVIEDVPLAETTLGDLPDEALAGIPETVRDGLGELPLATAPEQFGEHIRPALPERSRDLVRQVEEQVVDGAIHAEIGLHEGDVTHTRVLGSPANRGAGVVIRGPLTTWQQVVDGRPTLSALLTDDLAVETSATRLVRYSTMLQLLGEAAAEVETTHLFDDPGPSAHPVVDDLAGAAAALQRSTERRVRRALRNRRSESDPSHG